MHVIGTNGIPGPCSSYPKNYNQDWEYKCDMILIEQDGSIGFQEPAGLSISGGCSRIAPKKSFNVSFKSEYGQSKLNYKLFEDRDQDKYDGFKIRSGGNHVNKTFIDDAFTHKIIKDVLDIDESANRPTTVYLNGVYWGVFNIRDRLNKGYIDAYHPKVDDKDNTDVISLPRANAGVTFWLIENVSNGDHLTYYAFDDFINANDVNDASVFDQIKEMIDVNSFLDYFITNIYCNNGDWPGNNLKVWRDRNDGKFRWMMFDLDYLRLYNGGYNNQSLLGEILYNTGFSNSRNPIACSPFRKLLENDKLKNEFIQRAQTYIEIVWDPSRTDTIYNEMANKLAGEIDLNYAKWGGWNQTTWNNNQYLLKDFFHYREAPFSSMMESALSINSNKFILNLNFDNNTNGQVVLHNNYFVVPDNYSGVYYDDIPIKITAVADPGFRFSHWLETENTNEEIYDSYSSTTNLTPVFTSVDELVINEIFYNPIGASEDLEFIELHNPSNQTRNLSNFQFTNGVCFAFPSGSSIAPNEYIVIAKNASNYQGNGYQVFEWENSSLDNDGEKIELANLAKITVDSVRYNDASPWPIEADGLGFSLAYLEDGSDNFLGANWAIQSETIISPGASNIFCTPISINEFKFDVNCANGSDGFIQVSVSGGTFPYSYSWSNGSNTNIVSNIPAGFYTVSVTDNNGCQEEKSFNISEPSSTISIAISKQDQSNYNVNNGSATANPSGGTPGYSYSWSNGTSNQTANNLAPGNYTVTVSDDNNCTAIENISIDPVDCNIDASTSHSDVSYLGANDGSATASATGGPTPYSYSWSNGSSGASINNLSPGNYTVTATAANGCFDTASFTIDEVSCSLNASAAHTDISYLASNDGTATASASGGPSPFSYSWSNGSSNASINNLAPGNYTVTITAANGCFDSETITIDEVNCALSASTTQTNVTYFNSNNGTATATASGGPSPFSYSWSNGSSSASINNLAPGNYTVTVTAANGCFDSETITIDEVSCSLSASTSQTNVTYFGSNNGTATATASGGPNPFSYSWSNGSSSASINNLAPGNYTVTITAANGCFDSETITIDEVSCSLSASTSQTNVTYFGSNNGTATANASGGPNPYSYSWSNGSSSATVNNLAPGNYNVTITAANGCFDLATITIDEVDCASFSLSLNKTDETYLNTDDGSATANPIGTAPFTYTWSNGQSTKTINNLSPGNYTVTVTAANGCFDSETITIDEVSCSLSASTSQTNVTYFGSNNGTATATASGGPSPFSYSWSNGSNTSTVNNLTPGNYNVTVTAANGCFDLASLTVHELDCASFSLSLTKTDETYLNTDNGSATANPLGSAPYSYAWSNGQNTKIINNLSPGNYTVNVIDALGCSDIQSITIDAIVCNNFSLTTSSTNVTFVNANDGTATASPSGVAPYSYSWSDGSTTGSINGLAPGTYTVTVVDAVGCSGTVAVNIGDVICAGLSLSTSSTDESIFEIADGTATAIPSGGNSPYSFDWSNGQTTASINGLAAGTYEVTITDDLACTLIDQIEIFAGNTGEIFGKIFIDHNQDAQFNAGDQWLSGVDVVIIESNGNNYAVTTDVNGLWQTTVKTGLTSIDINENDLPADASQILGTDPSLYNVAQGEIKDAGLSGYILQCANISINQTINQMVSCIGFNDGSVSLQTIDGQAPFAYAWSDGSTSAIRNNLIAGNYMVTVTDGNNCSNVTSFSVIEPNVLSATITETHQTYFNTNDGTALSNVIGGTPPYTYLWSNGSTSASLNQLAPGNYSLTVNDDRNCTTIVNTNIIPVDCSAFQLSVPHTDESIFQGNDGTAEAVTSGGQNPYSFNWSNGSTLASIDQLTPGDYSVAVTDNLGCQIIDLVTIDPVDCGNFSMLINSTDLSAVGLNDGTCSVITTGGSAPYSYLWNTGSINESINDLNVGNYSVTVIDALNCQHTASAVVNSVDCSSLIVEIHATDEISYQGNDGAASATIIGGVEPYQYQWSNGSQDLAVDNLAPGNYTLSITDNLSCTKIKNFNILEAQVAFLSGKVYSDHNQNATFDNNDIGLEGIDILITESDGNTKTIYTDANGTWTLPVIPGHSLVSIEDSNNLLQGASLMEGTASIFIMAVTGQNTIVGDIGYYYFTEVCGSLFYDNNENGLKDLNESQLSSVAVIITDSQANTQTITTDANGNFCKKIPPGNYDFFIDTHDDDFPKGSFFTQSVNPFNYTIVQGANQIVPIGIHRNMNLQIRVFLEGALNSGSGNVTFESTMRSALNEIQVLPGQTYIGGLFGNVYFPSGQPYNQSPWNYSGTEGIPFDSQGDESQADANYPPNIVDWVLVSIRTTIDPSSEVCKAAALLKTDGSITFTDGFNCDDLDNEYFIVVEHRNHLICMSQTKIALNNEDLIFDFSQNQSYQDFFGLSIGQKEVVNTEGQTVYVMYAGNADQLTTISADTDINVNDKIEWEQSNNSFPTYSSADFDLSADVNVNDKLMWEKNNNNFSSVPR